MATEDVYIKDGVILRGNEATEELARKDAEEVIRESGLETPKKKSVTLRLRKPRACVSAKMCKTDAMSNSATGASLSCDLGQGEATAHGIKAKALSASGEGLSMKGTIRTFANVAGAQLKTATLGGSAVDFDVGGEVGISAKAVDVKALNVSASGVRTGAHVQSTATAKLVDTKVVNANVTGVEIAAEAEASAAAKLIDAKLANVDVTGLVIAAEAGATATAKGADIKAANLRVAGAEITTRAEAKAEATGLEVNAANAKMVGYKKHKGVGASAQAKGLEVKAATANITGIEDKKEMTAEARVVGKQVDAANFKYVHKKTGASAKAKVEAQGAKVQVANVNVEGEDSSLSASANVNVAPASAKLANVNVTPRDGVHFHATADISPGIDAFNVDVGTHKGAGIGVSTKLQFGNVNLSAGPPSLNLGLGLNLGIGGRSSQNGQQSSSGSNSDGSSYTTEGRHRLDTMGHSGTSMACRAIAGSGMHKNDKQQGTVPSSANGGEHNARNAGQVASSNGHTTNAYGRNSNSHGAGHGGSNSEYFANSSAHTASIRDYRARSRRRETADGLYYSSSTGPAASNDGHATTQEGVRSTGFEFSNGRYSLGQVAKGDRHSTTSSGRRATQGEGSGTYSTGHIASGTDFEGKCKEHWSTGGEHGTNATGNGMRSGWHMMQNGMKVKAHENPSGEYDTTRSGAMTKHSGYGGNNTSQVNISGDETIGTEYSTSPTGQAVKSSGHMPNRIEHGSSYRVKSTRKVALTDEHVTMTTEHKLRRSRTENERSVHMASNTGHPTSLKAGSSRRATTSMKQSSGFASTHRRIDSQDHQPTIPTENPDIGSNKSVIGPSSHCGWRRPSNDEEDGQKPEKKGTVRYADMLTSHVSKHVHSLQPPESKKKHKSEKKELPLSREEAKRELVRQLRKVHQESDEEKMSGKDSSKVSGTGGEKQDGTKSKAEGSAKNVPEREENTIPESKEKPFGSNKNIFTLGCFQNESSKKVKKISDRVHGFEA